MNLSTTQALAPYEPRQGEAAILSLIAVREDNVWVAASLSLLTVEASQTTGSWDRWKERQPQAERRQAESGFDLGPVFDVQPFEGVRALRQPVLSSRWQEVAEQVGRGRIEALIAPIELRAGLWSPAVTLWTDGSLEAERVVRGASRPVRAVVSRLEHPEVPPACRDTWEWPLPPHLLPGRDLGKIAPQRRLLHWPRRLCGIDWLGDPTFQPPARAVVGRLADSAWINRVRPDFEQHQLVIDVAWDAEVIDPLGASVAVRGQFDDLPIASRQFRISDLPMHSPASPEPRHMSWDKRLLTIEVPRGARRADWGVELIAADGRLLDERRVARRIEQISFTIAIDGAEPDEPTVVGDPNPPPTRDEQEELAAAAADLDAQARAAAAARRLSTSGQVADYLRARFACRAGELLILDPHLCRYQDTGELELSFLSELDRNIRGLTAKTPDARAASQPGIDIRRLPGGVRLHDRVWIVGETALLVGSSLNGLLKRQDGKSRGIHTVSELPFADAIAWRETFEEWWAATPS